MTWSRAARPSVRQLSTSTTLSLKQSSPLAKIETMKQIDVDEADIQKKLGKLNMDFVRKAERKNSERAKRHRFFRRGDWMIAGTCFGIVIAIYGYTIYAIQQEQFLDDFEMPEEIDRIEEEE